MPDKEIKTNPLAKTLTELTDKLQAVKGGRLILALATGTMNIIPIGAAVGSGVLEYRNLYASAAVDEKIARLATKIEEVSAVLNSQGELLNTLVDMIQEISSRLDDYIGALAFEKVDDLDAVAGSMLKPVSPQVTQALAAANQLDILLEEKSFEVILIRLDELPQLPPERARLIRTKALYGMGKFEELYVLLKKEPFSALSQEELENFIWACFQLGYTGDGLEGLRYHETNFQSPPNKIFISAVKRRFSLGRRTQNQERRNI